MHSGFTESLETQIEMELRNIGVMARIQDAREAITAFTAKRAPVPRLGIRNRPLQVRQGRCHPLRLLKI
jgi:hypothetical protein